MYFVLIYEYVPDYLERRSQFREQHIQLAQQAVDDKQLLLGGALTEPTDKALLLFSGESPAVAEDFARRDPYVTNGLVTHWEVRPWNIVIGTGR